MQVAEQRIQLAEAREGSYHSGRSAARLFCDMERQKNVGQKG